MTKGIQIGASISATSTTANTTQFWQLNGSLNVTSTEANSQMKVYTAGTYSNLRVKLTINGVAAVSNFNFRKNGANGNQSAPTIASTTGIFEDPTNTDTVTSGDLINVSSVPGTTVGTMGAVSFASDFDTGGSSTVTRMIYGCTTGMTSNTGSGATFFLPLMGNITFNSTASSTETTSQVLQRVSGIFQNLSIKLSTNSRTSADTVVFRKNAADGNQTISITASTSGYFQDTVNTDAVVTGDLVCYSIRNAAVATGRTLEYFSVEFVTTTNPGTSQLCTGPTSSTATTVAVNSSHWIPMGGASATTATESVAQLQVYYAYTFHDLSINIITNPATGAGAFTLRQNAASSALTVPISGGATGWLTDSTHTVTTTANDLLDLQLTTGTGSGSVTYGCSSVFADIAGPGGGSITCSVTVKTVTNKFITKI